MEGYNGWARPLDQQIQQRGYRLLNVNNLKLARFKEIFPAPAKNDHIDTDKMLELFQLGDTLARAKNVIQEVKPVEGIGGLFDLNRCRVQARQPAGFAARDRELRGAVLGWRGSAMRSCRLTRRAGSWWPAGRCAGPIGATWEGLTVFLDHPEVMDNRWFLSFMTARKNLRQLSRLRRNSVLKIKGIGSFYADIIQPGWQKDACFSAEVLWVGEMIHNDAATSRMLELIGQTVRQIGASQPARALSCLDWRADCSSGAKRTVASSR